MILSHYGRRRLFKLSTLSMVAGSLLLAAGDMGIAKAASVKQSKAQPAVTSSTGALKLDPKRFVDESELKAGQRGYALSVITGTKIEKFGVEILGVARNVNRGKSLILIKLLDGQAVKRHINVAAGMSGSPIYIGNRLVGAISYSWGWGKEPIGLATPIKDMFDSFDPTIPKHLNFGVSGSASAESSESDSDASVSISNKIIASMLGSEKIFGLDPQGSTTFEALPTQLSGGLEGAMDAGIRGLGLIPVFGESADTPRKATAKDFALIQPGSSVGMSLSTGAVNLTAIGTVTYRDGDKILAFGHPFQNLGPIQAPMTTANIFTTYPSYSNSTKLGAPGATVGTVFVDRPYSIGGVVGKLPTLAPVNVHVSTEYPKLDKYYKSQVVNHPLLTGALALYDVSGVLSRAYTLPGEAVATVTTDVEAEGYGHIVRTNTYYDGNKVTTQTLGDLVKIVRALVVNPYFPVAIKSVNVDVKIRSSHDTSQIESIFVPKTKFEPGETVKVGVVVRPYKSDPIVRTIELTIPPTTPNGLVTITVRGGAAKIVDPADKKAVASLTPVKKAGVPIPTNTAQVIRHILEQPTGSQVEAKLLLPTNRYGVHGDKLEFVPARLAAILGAPGTTSARAEHDEVKTVQNWSSVVTGAQAITIQVERKNLLDTAVRHIATKTIVPAATTLDDKDKDADKDTTDATEKTPTGGDKDNSVSALISSAASDNLTDSIADAPAHPAAVSTKASAARPVVTTAKDDAQTVAKNALRTKLGAISRIVQTWRQDGAEQFLLGQFDGVSASSANELRVAASPAEFSTTPSEHVVSLAVGADNQLYAGTGDDGVIYKVSSDGKAVVFHKTNGYEVTALAVDSKSGYVYAGVAPGGVALRIDPSGKAEKISQTDGAYITSITIDNAANTVYFGESGVSGKLLSAPLDGTSAAKTIWSSTAENIDAVTVGANGVVYAAASPGGRVYAIDSDGKSSLIYSAADQSISGLAASSNGALYASLSPQNAIVKLTLNENAAADAKVLTGKGLPAILSLSASPTGEIYAAAGNTILSVDKDDNIITRTGADEIQFISLAPASNGAVYAGTGIPGKIFAVNPSPASATYTSAVHDAERPAAWGEISWSGNDGVSIQTRSGNVAAPDESWSQWSDAYTQPSGSKVTSPAARYIQYRVRFTGADAVLRSASISYLPSNRAPIIKVTAPASGDAVSGGVLVKWIGNDPDGDTLSYAISYSADGVKWSQAAAAPTLGLAHLWQTASLPSGQYWLKVTASDQPSNPKGALTGSAVVGSVIVDNVAPTITIDAAKTIVENKSVSLFGLAAGSLAPIVAVQYRIDDKGSWLSAEADSGLFGSVQEAFRLKSLALTSGDHTIIVKAINQAGTSGLVTVPVTVP